MMRIRKVKRNMFIFLMAYEDGIIVYKGYWVDKHGYISEKAHIGDLFSGADYRVELAYIVERIGKTSVVMI